MRLLVSVISAWLLWHPSGLPLQFDEALAKQMLNYATVSFCDESQIKHWSCPICGLSPALTNVTVVQDMKLQLRAYVGFQQQTPGSSAGPTAVVAFRGTVDKDLKNWEEDLGVGHAEPWYPHLPDGTVPMPNPSQYIGVTVHAGFYDAFSHLRGGIYAALQEKVRSLQPSSSSGFSSVNSSAEPLSVEERSLDATLLQKQHESWLRTQPSFLAGSASAKLPVLVTGHSLGGAMATLFAFEAPLLIPGIAISAVYTFGQPRTGSLAFSGAYVAAGLADRHFRVTHHHDPVPQYPWPILGFHHVPTEVFYPEEGGTDYRVCSRFEGEDSLGQNGACNFIFCLKPSDHTLYLNMTTGDQGCQAPVLGAESAAHESVRVLEDALRARSMKS